jgi:hypothetical protein
MPETPNGIASYRGGHEFGESGNLCSSTTVVLVQHNPLTLNS